MTKLPKTWIRPVYRQIGDDTSTRRFMGEAICYDDCCNDWTAHSIAKVKGECPVVEKRINGKMSYLVSDFATEVERDAYRKKIDALHDGIRLSMSA